MESPDTEIYGRIYKITCSVTSKSYIGQTTYPVRARFKQHLHAAVHKPTKGGLSAAIRKHGPETFSVVELEVCHSKSRLDEREVVLIAEHGTLVSGGYNLDVGGISHRHTAEAKSAIGASNSGRPHSAERRKNISAANTRFRYNYRGQSLSIRELYEGFLPEGSKLTLAQLKARIMICKMDPETALNQHLILRPR